MTYKSVMLKERNLHYERMQKIINEPPVPDMEDFDDILVDLKNTLTRKAVHLKIIQILHREVRRRKHFKCLAKKYKKRADEYRCTIAGLKSMLYQRYVTIQDLEHENKHIKANLDELANRKAEELRKDWDFHEGMKYCMQIDNLNQQLNIYRNMAPKPEDMSEAQLKNCIWITPAQQQNLERALNEGIRAKAELDKCRQTLNDIRTSIMNLQPNKKS